MKRSTLNKYAWLLIFAIAMAFMESAVVIYLRNIYYPNGFSFPLNAIDPFIGLVEIVREAATIIMLFSIAVLTGKNRIMRFAYFLFVFAIWDIFYYVFLKLFIGWPENILTWDILFLIPLTWTGPVITPVINSITMILVALTISYFNDKYAKIIKLKLLIILLIIGSVIILFAYVQPYILYMRQNFSFFEMMNINNAEVLKFSSTFIPVSFNWLAFGSGVLLQFLSIGYFILKNFNKTQSNKLI
ncbi:MAG: hypothetical protein GXO79_02510 [Chlorobi bacterium]|nr:hypothetical protein [Chlorobiota bacterium]